jgi:flagellar protein FliT
VVAEDGVLTAYERALSLTRAMLDAARRADWDELVRLEGERSRAVEQIRMEDPAPGRDALAGRKRAILTEMMQADEQVQLLTQDWMHELREVLDSIRTEQRLSRTYGP